MPSSVLKWGIASCGLISNDFCNALNMANEGQKIVAVAARDATRAEKFAQTHKIDKFYGSYEELAQDPDVDIVYVASIHATHYKISHLMLSHNKHVLCEKPMTLSHSDTLRLISLAKERKLFLMEGMWSRCTPVYKQVRQELDSGTLGDVHSLTVTFSAPVIPSRLQRNEEPGSVLLAIGVYLLQLASLVFGNQPTSKVFTGHTTDFGTDDYLSIVLQYRDGQQVAHMMCDGRFNGGENNTALISGSKGNITVLAPFWTPVSVVTPGGRRQYELPSAGEGSAAAAGHELTNMNYENSENFLHEIQHVRQCIQEGKVESGLMPHADSLHVAALVDEAVATLGIKL